MGATVVKDVFIYGLKGLARNIFVMCEYTYEKNCYPHEPHLCAMKIGTEQQIIGRAIHAASAFEDGCAQGYSPAGFIRETRHALTFAKMKMMNRPDSDMFSKRKCEYSFKGSADLSHEVGPLLQTIFNKWGVEMNGYIDLNDPNHVEAICEFCNTAGVPPWYFGLSNCFGRTEKGDRDFYVNRIQNVGRNGYPEAVKGSHTGFPLDYVICQLDDGNTASLQIIVPVKGKPFIAKTGAFRYFLENHLQVIEDREPGSAEWYIANYKKWAKTITRVVSITGVLTKEQYIKAHKSVYTNPEYLDKEISSLAKEFESVAGVGAERIEFNNQDLLAQTSEAFKIGWWFLPVSLEVNQVSGLEFFEEQINLFESAA